MRMDGCRFILVNRLNLILTSGQWFDNLCIDEYLLHATWLLECLQDVFLILLVHQIFGELILLLDTTRQQRRIIVELERPSLRQSVRLFIEDRALTHSRAQQKRLLLVSGIVFEIVIVVAISRHKPEVARQRVLLGLLFFLLHNLVKVRLINPLHVRRLHLGGLLWIVIQVPRIIVIHHLLDRVHQRFRWVESTFVAERNELICFVLVRWRILKFAVSINPFVEKRCR
mmetsp:Transcript_28772/g.47170  ORF Transcript_28772/g.47170 Transcript_28772/m.47170 type:complete len:228 (-) Transcript_28772:184-867(-)